LFSTEARIVLDDVAIARGGRTLASRLSLIAAPGALVTLRGPNGSGKTTLLRTIAGFRAPEAGRIERPPPETAIHFLGHAPALKGALSVRAHVAFWSALLGQGAPADAVLARAGLAALASLPARALSQGQARRLALARLLAAPRPIWLMDEPSAGLDQAGAAALETFIEDHRRSGGLVIAATHDAFAQSVSHVLELRP
jgi:heme exporter protein A